MSVEELVAAAAGPIPVTRHGTATRTAAEMEMLFNTTFGPGRWRSARAEAEGRRVWLMMWIMVERMEVTAPAAASAERGAAIVNPAIAVGEAMLKALLVYDHAPSGLGGAATQSKVRELEQTIAMVAGAVPLHGMKAREVLTVPSAFTHSVGGAGGSGTLYQKGPWAKKKDEEAAAAAAAAAAGTSAADARFERLEQLLVSSMAQGQRQAQYQQPAFSPAAAQQQQQMGQQIPFQQQQGGFGGGYGSRGPMLCHACNQPGHVAARCTDPGVMKARQAAMGGNQAVSH